MKSQHSSLRLFTRALLVLVVMGLALLLANSGCSGGAVCYRNTDCGSGFGCIEGMCLRVRPALDEAGIEIVGSAGSGNSLNGSGGQ